MIGGAGGLVTSTSTLASAQLHQTYQLTIKDLSDPPWSTGRPTHHLRKKLARNLLTILTAEECSCRASLVESKDAWWNPKTAALKTGGMNRCLEMNPMPANHVVPWTSSCKRKAKIRWYCKKNQNKINHQSSAACSSKKHVFFRWSRYLYDMIFQIQKWFILCCQSFSAISMRNLYEPFEAKQNGTSLPFSIAGFAVWAYYVRGHTWVRASRSNGIISKHFQTSWLCKGKRRFCQVGPPAVWCVYTPRTSILLVHLHIISYHRLGEQAPPPWNVEGLSRIIAIGWGQPRQ